MAQAGYDFEWLREGFLKRKANYSSIICFETGDSFRLSQLKGFLVSYRTYADADVYYLNNWSGLCRIDRETGKTEPVMRGASGGYDQGIQNNIAEMRDALKYMDNVLKSRKTVFILHDLDSQRPEEREKDLINALRDWAMNSDILLMDSVVILMCMKASMVLDPATMERVAVVGPSISLPAEREMLISDQWRKLLAPPLDSSIINLIVQSTAGVNLHQLETILLESYTKTKTFSLETIKDLKSEIIGRSDLLDIEETLPGGFESVGGYEIVKKFVRNTVIRALNEPQRAEAFNIKIPRGVIFFGPPGTGKTLFAKALAKEVNLPFINFRIENLYSQFLGVSGHKFRDAIDLIEQVSPAIVFIDEIDRLGKRREEVNDGASEETRRVFNQVLEWLGKADRKAIIIGTTNRPGDLDRAFRVGRIDYWIPFLYPNRAARLQIFKIHLKGTNLDDDTIVTLAEKTDGYSGAEIEELVNRANRMAFAGGSDRLTAADIFRAHETFRVDPSARRQEREKYIKMGEEYTNDLDFLRELQNES